MTLPQLVDRLLLKRCVVFLGRHDKYMLLNGMLNVGGWETIGSNDEEPPLTLANCISYDEIKLSALLSVSSYTYFLNIGDRTNRGLNELNRSKVEDEGIIIGLIGTRLEKPLVMEYQDIIISKEQNVHTHGYGKFFVPTIKSVFLGFYGEPSSTYDELKTNLSDPVKYVKLFNDEIYFNNSVYERRMALSFDTFLLEANSRAEEREKMAYVHVVGIGLGVWRISQHQDQLFMDAFAKRIQLLSNRLLNISDICFSYIKCVSCDTFKNGDKICIPEHSLGGIQIHIFNREPHQKLVGSDAGKLLVVSYAWDGNALPGNEFWIGSLAGSGDPAAASSTQVAELHNAHINTKVSGANLRIATTLGLMTFTEYQEHIKKVQGK